MDLKQIKERCTECCDCWLWNGITSKSGVPKINLHVGYGKGGRTVLSTRRVVWQMAKGPIPAKGLITVKCGNPRCLNPEHLKLTDHAKVAAKNGARLDVKAKRAAAQMSFNRKQKAKLNPEAVELIRASEESAAELAARYGVGVSCVDKVRRGVTWKDYSNPFAALMA